MYDLLGCYAAYIGSYRLFGTHPRSRSRGSSSPILITGVTNVPCLISLEKVLAVFHSVVKEKVKVLSIKH